MPDSIIRVAVVEDQAQIREGICSFLSNSPGFECSVACGSAEEALQELPKRSVDVVLMDIGLPGMSGIDCIRALKRMTPQVQIVMLTVFEDPERIFKSLEAGATGYLLKKTPPTKLLQAIQDVHQGGSPMSNQIARRVIQAFQKPVIQSEAGALLSAREQQVLDQLAQGLLYKEIAATLNISTETVRTHVRNIYEKLQVRTRTEALNKVRNL
jgi:DNA-binding NarL/FixJ family response regulator